MRVRRGEKNYCDVTTGDGTVIQFATITPLSPEDPQIPVVTLGFQVEQLKAISPVFREMARLEYPPSIYIWDEDKEICAVLIFFYLVSPDPRIVAEVAGNEYEELVQGVASWEHLTVCSIFDMPQKETLDFIRKFQQADKAEIHIEEVWNEHRSGIRIAQYPDLLHDFTTDQLNRRPFFEKR